MLYSLTFSFLRIISINRLSLCHTLLQIIIVMNNITSLSMSGVTLSRYAAFIFVCLIGSILKHDTSCPTLCQITNSDLQPATCKLHPPLKHTTQKGSKTITLRKQTYTVETNGTTKKY